MNAEIVIQNPNGYPEGSPRRIRPWLEALVGALVPELFAELAPGAASATGESVSLGVRFGGDRWLRRLNRTYRERDRPTDVLSFAGDETPDGRHLGDIAISVPTARRQAEAGGRPVAEELQVLLLHGVLHCLGYDHETDDGAMERLERRLRRQWIGEGRDGSGARRAAG